MNFVELSFSTQYVVNVLDAGQIIVIVPCIYTGGLFAKDQGRCVTKLKFVKFSLFVRIKMRTKMPKPVFIEVTEKLDKAFYNYVRYLLFIIVAACFDIFKDICR